ncbi:MAG: aromatic ring-hydroxylating dioxygenase subunit alpha [Sphingomonadaceae bacterium]|uniref:aromatic ring-hydroxylating dioxygenase subunit alpha n=1 Tax=Thermaurantiacus sp. TaxID=2820283 RepID=UPI00298F0442|nr:aromatic ring-hydroxylating dioxygenase subunit alpha [Thermaurantiacus sp.]MCS6987549.1 aromatic ring-hydroxylating dioxygenase subunit alpha [Sphingomonadaceae bacterium]MDW8415150.1 aromatic ring-hydroxylating dioxygenase subunit alpha [Thermaurantiacus sp.]
MIINQWYVAAESAEVTAAAPRKVRLLGLDFTLFRDPAGRVHCLSDVCVHRGASLGEGRIERGCVECPYHGWWFDGEGQVRRIPSLPPDTPIPKRARVDAYPVVERYGWVWVFLGDLPEAERPPLPDFPEYEDRANWRCIRGDWHWRANYARVVENGLDFAHAPFVHPSFGDRERAEIHDFEVEADAWSARAKVTYIPPLPRGVWKWLRRERTPVQAQPSFHLSGATMRLDVWLTPSWRMVIFDVNTPVDEVTTHTRWIMARNFFRHPLFDGDARRRTLKIFRQDTAIVEKICPEIVPLDLTEEFSVKSDALMNAFRQRRRELVERGWAIDVETLRHHLDGRRALVIPSPARRAAGGRNFVLKTVPLLPPRAPSPEPLRTAAA